VCLLRGTDCLCVLCGSENKQLRGSVFTARCGLYVCVLCGSENKQRLFPYAALTDWFLEMRGSVFTVRYGLYVFCVVLRTSSDYFPIQH
jgi:hypothetical protein